jgi:bacteriorhodopsin
MTGMRWLLAAALLVQLTAANKKVVTYTSEDGVSSVDPDVAHSKERFDATVRPMIREENGLDYVQPSKNWEVAPEPFFEAPEVKKVSKKVQVIAQFSRRTEIGTKWVMFGWLCMFVASAYICYRAFFYAERGSRMVHFLALATCLIATLAYMSMVFPLGYYNMPTREVYWARYVDWVLTTPIMLYEIATIAGASDNQKLFVVGCDILMVVAGCIGAFVEGDEKYAFWGFGLIMFVPIIYYLLVEFAQDVKRNASAEVQHLYSVISRLTAFFWACYPFVWFFCEGEGTMSADTEAMLYTVLDVVSKAVWGIYIVRSSVALSHVGNKRETPSVASA